MSNPLAVALRGKGPFTLARRVVSILRQYGLTPRSMERELQTLAGVLREFQCQGTFPTVAAVLARHPRLFQKYQAQGLEFAIHGYRHIDHNLAPHARQVAMLAQAKRVFAEAAVNAHGFRGPYLHANADTLDALRAHSLAYDSSQGLAWDVLDGPAPLAYRHVLDFYGALPAAQYPALPSLQDGLVRIPYSLPDDEALANRLGLQGSVQKDALWLAILRRTYELGELFTVGLHPERARFCSAPLTAVLRTARELDPAVWIARLDEIAAWWRARAAAVIRCVPLNAGHWRLEIEAPLGATVLARRVAIAAPTQPWADGYEQVLAMTFKVQASVRPWIGVSPNTAAALIGFLREQGYIVEETTQPVGYAAAFDRPQFAPEDCRPLLAALERSDCPLVRLGRWPYGTRSALAVTGDIDCLTLWDYLARLGEH